MRDTELYAGLLAVKHPWRVVEAELVTAEQEVLIHLEKLEPKLPFPECGALCPRHDGQLLRLRQLDTCQLQTIDGRAAGKVQGAWRQADEGGLGREGLAVHRVVRGAGDLLAAGSEPFGGAQDLGAELDGSGRDSVVRCGLERRRAQLPEYLGIDATSFRGRHEYVKVPCDQARGHVAHVAYGRSAEAGRATSSTPMSRCARGCEP